jgi:hypothetical protein
LPPEWAGELRLDGAANLRHSAAHGNYYKRIAMSLTTKELVDVPSSGALVSA